MAAEEAPGGPRGPDVGRRGGGGPGGQERAARGAAGAERHDAGGDPARVELAGKAPQVEAVLILVDLMTSSMFAATLQR